MLRSGAHGHGWPWLIVVWLAVVSACSAPAPDLVLLNGRVFTADPEQPWAEAIAVRGDRIVAVGTSAEVAAMAGPSTVRRDVAGRAVVPGFNDAHVFDAGAGAGAVRTIAAEAMASGVTSMQWFVGARTVQEVGRVLVEADIPIRVHVFRMPRPGPDGTTVDNRPHLPPQPSLRIDIRGIGFRLGADDGDRIRQAVGRAFGTEDQLALQPLDDAALMAYVDAVTQIGIPEVWRMKRPRIDQAPRAAVAVASRIAELGLVAVQRPDEDVPLASLLAAGVPLGLGTGTTTGTRPFEALASFMASERGAERLTAEQAVAAFTRGSSFAERAERDKGHLSVGAVADLAVLSVDPFRDDADLTGACSVLTLIGGRVVHDVP